MVTKGMEFSKWVVWLAGVILAAGALCWNVRANTNQLWEHNGKIGKLELAAAKMEVHLGRLEGIERKLDRLLVARGVKEDVR